MSKSKQSKSAPIKKTVSRAKHASGAVRMAELGKRPVQLWFTVEDLERLKRAAKADRRPVTQFITIHILNILERKEGSADE